jgi:hypothetical protein
MCAVAAAYGVQFNGGADDGRVRHFSHYFVQNGLHTERFTHRTVYTQIGLHPPTVHVTILTTGSERDPGRRRARAGHAVPDGGEPRGGRAVRGHGPDGERVRARRRAAVAAVPPR